MSRIQFDWISVWTHLAEELLQMYIFNVFVCVFLPSSVNKKKGAKNLFYELNLGYFNVQH